LPLSQTSLYIWTTNGAVYSLISLARLVFNKMVVHWLQHQLTILLVWSEWVCQTSIYLSCLC